MLREWSRKVCKSLPKMQVQFKQKSGFQKEKGKKNSVFFFFFFSSEWNNIERENIKIGKGDLLNKIHEELEKEEWWRKIKVCINSGQKIMLFYRF